MENNKEIIDLSFKIVETLVAVKEFKSKDEALKMINSMCNVANSSSDYPDTIKMAYKEAVKKVEYLSFDELCELRDLVLKHNS
jgi:hypothetical protein